MSASLLRITRAFAPRPVVYRTIDFRSNEFRGLDGGAEFEPVENNPMIGYRGCYRYVREPDLFRLEMEILARVRDETPNLHLMIPFVRTRWELEACLELVDASPLGSPAWTPPVGDGRGSVGRLPHSRVRRARHRRRLDRLERPHAAHARRRSRLRDLRRAVRRVRRGGARRDPADHHGRARRGHHVFAVRAGTVEPSRVRRAPRALRHHLDLGEPRRRPGTHGAPIGAAERRILLDAARRA